MLIIGIGSHVTFAFCHFTLMIPTVDATVGRTVPYIVLNHAAQHLSFLLGCFLGQSLISGQRRFFDEAWKLRIKLLERRCQQLEEEKERADYDRQLVQHAVDQRMNKRASRDEDSMSGISGLSGSRASAAGAPPVPPEAPPNTIVLRSSAVPAGPHNGGMAMVANAGANGNVSKPIETSVAPNRDARDGVAPTRDAMLKDGVCAPTAVQLLRGALAPTEGVIAPTSEHALPKSPEASIGVAPTKGALPKESSIPLVPGRFKYAASSAGWTELDRLISASMNNSEEPPASVGASEEAASAAKDRAESPAKLNPNAREWAPPPMVAGDTSPMAGGSQAGGEEVA